MIDGFTTARLDNPVMSSHAIKTLNRMGAKEGDERLKLIDDCRVAIAKMPQGKRGICVGSGDLTDIWRQRGWETLDLAKEYEPTYAVDANSMIKHLGSDKYDYVYVENISMSNLGGRDGVIRNRLIRQVNAILKKGGKLILQTADFGPLERNCTPLPIAEYFLPFLIKSGFKPYLEVADKTIFQDSSKRSLGERVVYYAEKISDNFDRQRYPHATPLRIENIK